MVYLTQAHRDLMDNATTAAAAGAIASPIWLPWLQTASELAAVIAPILGVIWLLVQIWSKISITLHEKDDK